MAGATLPSPGQLVRRHRPSPVFALSASGIKLDPAAKRGAEEALPDERPEHKLAWEHYEKVGEVGEIVSSSAALLSQCRFYVGMVLPDGSEVSVRDADGRPIEGLDERFVAAAEATLARYVDQSGAQRGLIRAQAECFHVVGDSYLVGWPVDAAGRPWNGDERQAARTRWEVVARSSLQTVGSGNTTRYRIVLDRRTNPIELPAAAIAYRMWRRSPRYPNESTAWVLRAADAITDLRIFTLAQRSAARSSIPADITVVAAEAQPRTPGTLPAPQMPTDPTKPLGQEWATYIEKMIGDAVLEVLQDSQSGRAIVGPVLAVSKEYVKEGFSSISLHRDVDGGLQALVEQAQRRIVECSDSSPEMLKGLGETNRWNGAQIDDTEYRRYYRPLAIDIADSWTLELLWGGLLAAGWSIEDARRVRVLVDASGVVADPDLSKNATAGLMAGAISPAAWRRANGFTEEDAPTPEEQRLYLSSRRRQASSGSGSETPPEEPTEIQASAVLVSSAVEPLDRLGDDLLAVERELRGRLAEACEAAVEAAIARAGSKLRNWIRSNRELSAALAAVPPRELPSRLGTRRTAALLADRYEDDAQRREEMYLAALLVALAASDRIIRGGYASTRLLLARYYELGGGDDAARAAVAELPDAEIDANVEAARAVLRGSLLDVTDQAVMNPDAPIGPGEVVAMTVPAAVIIRALAAGGGTPTDAGLSPDPNAAAGFIGGRTIANLAPPRFGWRWSYGTTLTRLAPFVEHERLDGLVGVDADDPVFSGSFLHASGQWFPGDHQGCQCAWAPVFGAAR